MKNSKLYKHKMDKEELQSYLQIMKQHHIVKNKKGKGSYSRKQKYSLKDVNDI